MATQAENARRLAELGMATELAREVASQIATGASTNAAVAALVSLTDSSGGTPSNTIVDTPASYVEATIANQQASFAAKINAIIAALKS
jgi:hypothetical protein